MNVGQQQDSDSGRLSESEFALGEADSSGVGRHAEFEIRPEELVEPKEHRATPTGPVLMWTAVELGVSTRIVRAAPICLNDEAKSLELQASFLFNLKSLSLSGSLQVRTAGV